MGSRHDLIRAVETTESARRELVRRLVLEDHLPRAERVAVLATEVLGYQVKPFHLDLLKNQDEHRESLNLAPRGYGKSTVGTVARSVFEVLVDPNVRILIVSNTALQAEVFLREIKAKLASPEVTEIFGPQVGAKWDATEINVAPRTADWKESTISTLGVGGPVASRHYDLILADDLVDEDNARTETQREKLWTWYGKTLYPTIVDETSRVAMSGTRFHPLDLYGRLAKKDRDIHVLVVRALGKNDETPWPEKFSVDRLKALRVKFGTAVFNSQYQNDTELMKGAIFRPDWFRTYDAPPVATDDDGTPRRHDDGTPFEPWEGFETFVGGDPAATKQTVMLTAKKASTDYWTIAVVSRELDPDEMGYRDRFYFRFLWRGRVTKAEYIGQLRNVYDRFRPQRIGMEDVGAQEYLVQDLRNEGLPVMGVGRQTDKVSRAYRMQPYFENGQVLFPDESLWPTGQYGTEDTWRAFLDELTMFPDVEHDDLFDAAETAVDQAKVQVEAFVA